MLDIKVNEVYTFKLNSGEELVAKVLEIQDNIVDITEPISVAPSQKGMTLIPSLFTADLEGKFRLNINSVSVVGQTNEQIKVKYIEATTGLTVPEKKIVLG